MTAVSVTASEVDAGTGVTFENYIASEAIDAGELCYVTGGNLAALADNNVDAATAKVVGIAVNSAAAGQRVSLQTDGILTIGASASVAAGDVFWLGATAGSFGPEADIGSGAYMTMIGIGMTSNRIYLNIKAFGVTHA